VNRQQKNPAATPLTTTRTEAAEGDPTVPIRRLPAISTTRHLDLQRHSPVMYRKPKRPSVGLSFSDIARMASHAFGSAWAFAAACGVVLAWSLTGPLFHYSDGWQLVINTGTTIVTFLMVFLIQNTQNRDARAIHLKLDELIRSTNAARNRLIDLENCTDEELDRVQRDFEKLRGRRLGVTKPDERTDPPSMSTSAAHRT
jgi:low affinity Fe/Cu permease